MPKVQPKIEIYTWRTCPFCIRAKQLLDRKNVDYIEHAIDGDENARQAMVARGSDGKRSVPQVFINDTHIGGCDAIHALDATGKLDSLLTG
jgi:glutaredoxin 3